MSYIYFLKNKTTGLKYIGVKYAKNDCNPSDFWVTYFTSSNSIKKLINVYGIEDFQYKILHVYTTPEEAILKELEYVKLAIKHKDYVNFCQFKVTPETASKAGKIGGNVQVKLKQGIHKQSREERLILLKNAREIQLTNKKNMFVNCDVEKQKERGRKGGAKNKGFRWYNDTTSSFKYTKKQQEQKSFEEFLNENSQFKKGLINTWSK